MGKKITVIFSLLFSFFLFWSMTYLATSKNWVEVDRFTGSSWYGGTRSFKISYPEWRIIWKYEPITDYEVKSLSNFYFQVKKVGDKTFDIVLGNNKPNGAFYLLEKGEFYLLIRGGLNAKNYTIIIEQNID